MDELSEKIEPYIDEVVAEYGLKCVRFSLAGMGMGMAAGNPVGRFSIHSVYS